MFVTLINRNFRLFKVETLYQDLVILALAN